MKSMTSYKTNQLSGIHQISRRIELNFLDVLSATKFVGLIQRTSVTEMVVLVRKEGKSFLLFFFVIKASNFTLLVHSANDAFVSTGFNNWKHTTACYRKHKMSSAHVESCLKWNQHVKGVSVDVQLVTEKQQAKFASHGA